VAQHDPPATARTGVVDVRLDLESVVLPTDLELDPGVAAGAGPQDVPVLGVRRSGGQRESRCGQGERRTEGGDPASGTAGDDVHGCLLEVRAPERHSE
jgi:hypothetical protein